MGWPGRSWPTLALACSLPSESLSIPNAPLAPNPSQGFCCQPAPTHRLGARALPSSPEPLSQPIGQPSDVPWPPSRRLALGSSKGGAGLWPEGSGRVARSRRKRGRLSTAKRGRGSCQLRTTGTLEVVPAAAAGRQHSPCCVVLGRRAYPGPSLA